MFESITETCREVPDHLRCRHILDDGRRCGSYALRNEHFCYYHHADRKPAPDPQARYARRNTITLPAPTSRAAIQEAIGKIIISLASNDIDRRRAGLLLYGLQLAALNIARHREDQPHTNELSQQDDASAPQDSTSTATRSHPSPVSCHPSPKAEDLRFSQPATNAPEPNHHQQTDPFTEEVFPLPKPKLYPLPRAGAALLLRSLAQHLNVEPSPGTPEDRRTEPAASETTETILPALSAVAVVSSPPTRTNSRHLDRSSAFRAPSTHVISTEARSAERRDPCISPSTRNRAQRRGRSPSFTYPYPHPSAMQLSCGNFHVARCYDYHPRSRNRLSSVSV